MKTARSSWSRHRRRNRWSSPLWRRCWRDRVRDRRRSWTTGNCRRVWDRWWGTRRPTVPRWRSASDGWIASCRDSIPCRSSYSYTTTYRWLRRRPPRRTRWGWRKQRTMMLAMPLQKQPFWLGYILFVAYVKECLICTRCDWTAVPQKLKSIWLMSRRPSQMDCIVNQYCKQMNGHSPTICPP